MNFQINPLILFSAFIIATGVRSYYYGPGSVGYYDQRTPPVSTYGIIGSDHDHHHDQYHHRDHCHHVHREAPPAPFLMSTQRGPSMFSYFRNMIGSFGDSFPHQHQHQHSIDSYGFPISNPQAHGGYRSEPVSQNPTFKMVPVQYVPPNQHITALYQRTSR